MEDFERDLTKDLKRLTEQLRDGGYRPQAVRRVWIPKPGSTEKRPLGVPTVRDRVVQAALRLVLEPIFERDFAAQSYGFRPNRGCKDALRRVDALLQQGYTWIVDADLKSYFDTIPHEPLLERVCEKVSDGAVLDLVEAFLNQQVLDGMKSWTPEGGTPQGAVLSPLLSNHLPGPAGSPDGRGGDRDGALRGRLRAAVPEPGGSRASLGTGAGMDGDSRTDACIRSRHGLSMPDQESFDFLGYRFDRGKKWPSREEPEQIPGHDAIQDATHPRRELEGHLSPTLTAL